MIIYPTEILPQHLEMEELDKEMSGQGEMLRRDIRVYREKYFVCPQLIIMKFLTESSQRF